MRRLFCRHTTIHIARWHADCVTRNMRGKELYVDVHKVVNFARCSKCGAFLQGERKERVYAERDE